MIAGGMLSSLAPGTPIPSAAVLSAGIVAHDEERNLEGAVRSLLDQELPVGTRWERLWVVASGCTDRTPEIAKRLAEEDPRVVAVIETERMGKSHALREVIHRARGDALVLLNADARAEPGGVAELLRAGSGHPAPFAVMGRPVVPSGARSEWARTLSSMWEIHHAFHIELQQEGGGAHLSDELLLVSLAPPPPLPDGIINDGSYLGVWLAQHGGDRLYAPGARVTIDLPRRLKDHLRQRRRIRSGNDQVAAMLGTPPSTLARFALRSPGRALEILRRSVLSEKGGLARLACLGATEAAAGILAAWDRLPPARRYVLWPRVDGLGHPTSASSPAFSLSRPGPRLAAGEPLERRVTSLLEMARCFTTGISLRELAELLPRDAPCGAGEVRRWIVARPGIGRVEEDWVFLPNEPHPQNESRRERGLRYRDLASDVVHRRLGRALPLLRCLGITGSTAYGEPRAGDDIDFLVVARPGATWLFLAYAYVSLRLVRMAPGEPELCFNLVLDEHEAIGEFARSHGLLVAREALTARILLGEEYYRHLLASAPWMAEELPRLFESRATTEGPLPASPSLPASVRVLNAMIFPLLACYLQLVGLRRNHSLRRRGWDEAVFQTEIGPGRLAFRSRRFEALRREYSGACEARAEPAASSRPDARSEPGAPPGPRRLVERPGGSPNAGGTACGAMAGPAIRPGPERSAP